MKRYLEAGRLNSPRGLKGELRFECWCDDAEFLSGVSRLYLDPEGKRFLEVERYIPHLGTVIFKGYSDRTSASALTGRTLWFDREDVVLSEGTWFNDDLIGTPVFNDATGEKLGEIREVEEKGGRLLWHIAEDGMEFLFPPVPDLTVSVVPGEEIRIILIEGMDERYAI